jgi:hypothetical protein
MALNAAKSLPNAEAFVKGLPIPGDALGKVKAEMTTAIRDSAFAVNLVAAKIPDTFKDAKIPIPATDTVSRATVDAASSRIAGNDKIPPVNYGPPAPITAGAAETQLVGLQADLNNLVKVLNARAIFLSNLGEKVAALENQATITESEWAAVDTEYKQNGQTTTLPWFQK